MGRHRKLRSHKQRGGLWPFSSSDNNEQKPSSGSWFGWGSPAAPPAVAPPAAAAQPAVAPPAAAPPAVAPPADAPSSSYFGGRKRKTRKLKKSVRKSRRHRRK